MKRSFKKVIAVLLAALMLMSVMPITASADVIDGLAYGDEYDPNTYGWAYDLNTGAALMKVPTVELRAYPYTKAADKITSWDALNAAEEITDTTQLKAGDMIQLVSIFKDVTFMSFCQINYAIDETYATVGVTNSTGKTWTENANTAVLANGSSFDYGDGFLDGSGAYNVDENVIVLASMDLNAYNYGMYVGDRDLVAGTFAIKINSDCTLAQAVTERAGLSCVAYDLDSVINSNTISDDGTGNVCGPMNFVIPSMNVSASHTHVLGDPVYNGAAAKTHTATCTAADCDHSEGYTVTENCTFDEGVVTKEPTYTETGIKTFTCSVCHGTYTEDLPVKTCAHDGAKTYTRNSGDNKADQKHSVTCNVCGQVVTSAEPCNFSYEVTKAPSYTETGIGTYTCTLCGYSYTEVLDVVTCEHAKTEVRNAKPEKCTEDGYTGDTYCLDCGKLVKAGSVIPAPGHTEQVVTGTPATCVATGLTDGKVCSVCKVVLEAQKVIDKNPSNHAGPTSVVPEVPATMKEAGTTAGTKCDACGVIIDGCDPIPALGVPVTVEYSDMGAVTINGETVADKATEAKNVPYGSDYTLTATPVDGVKFVGWAMNGKLVSKDTTYVSTAYMPVTYTPVYEEVTTTTYTVVFVDKYANVIATVETAVGEAFNPASAPEAPAYIGYTFASWSVDLATITAATTVMAQYTADADNTFTVTANGCTIVSGASTAEDALAGLAYDAQVTVSAPGAAAWKIDGKVVFYGETYTFFVGSNVTVVPVTETVEKAPYVAKVSVTAVTGSHKFEFLATRSMSESGTLVEAGFIYGKAMTASDLTVEKVGTVVNGATVKIAYTQDKSEDAQFALSYGITAKNATATAVAFVTYKTASGEVKTIYSDLMEGTY